MCYVEGMERVGIRELRQNASEVLRRVAAGEPVEVTNHGRPVARIVPIPAGSGLDQLVAEGRATVAVGDLLAVAAIPQPAGAPRLSDVLAGLRDDER